MAIYKEDIADINLETGNIHRSFLRHSIGTQDQHADHFGIRVMRDGEPVDLTGISVQGVFMPPQGSPIAITGDTYTIVEGNVAKVILPQACYNYEGSFTLAIKLIDITDSITGTIRIIDGVVDNTHASGTVAPTGSVPTYQEILSVYDDLVDALADVASYAANFAPEFVQGTANAAGSFVMNDGVLYLLPDGHTAGTTWANTTKTHANVGGQLSDLKSAIGVNDLMGFASKAGNVSQGITYEYIGDNKWYIHGTYAGSSACNLFADTSHVAPFIPGKKYKVKFHCDTDDIHIQCYKYVGATSTLYQNIIGSDGYTEMVVPSDATGVVIRFRATDSVDTTVSLYIYEDSPIVETVLQGGEDIATLQTEIVKKLGFVSSLGSSDNLNNLGETGAYAYASSNQPDNIPEEAENVGGILTVVHGNSNTGYAVQYLSTHNGRMFQRTQYTNGDWGYWAEISNVALKAEIDEKLDTKLGFVKALTSTDDMNDLDETGAYAYAYSTHPDNIPPDSNSNAVVTVVHGFDRTGFCVQYVSTNDGHMYQRTQFTDGSWGYWAEIGTGSAPSTNDTYNYYNTYNITTSPTITTDTNGWLQAVDTESASETGKTDMTGAIMSMLTDTGYCHLGEGIFYVSGGIDMPAHSTLCGCGDKTDIRLLSSVENGYCVKMQTNCLITDISFSGSYSGINPTTDGHRNGIVFEANYHAGEGETSTQTEHSMINNVWIRKFSGSGIYCHNTSINYGRGLYATNVYIDYCYAGINITEYSEFHKFENVCTSWCKYGCINNGGNNVFSSCTFHAFDTGFYIDGNSANHAHGTITGCTFVHIGSNNGKAIHMVDVTNCFTINASVFGLDSIELENCSGILFNGCQFHRGIASRNKGYTINISGGNTIMICGSIFFNDSTYPPEITVTNNSKVKIDNCYGSTTGNAITLPA